MGNDYREFHTKVWVVYAAQTITHHMNYEWRFFISVSVLYEYKDLRETIVNGQPFVTHTFYAYLQYIRSPLWHQIF